MGTLAPKSDFRQRVTLARKSPKDYTMMGIRCEFLCVAFKEEDSI